MLEPHQNPPRDDHDTPPVLLWLGIGFVLLVIITGIVGVVVYRGEGRVGSLIPVGIGFVAVLVVGTLGTGILLRKRLPRYFLPALIVGVVVLIVIGGAASIFIYANVLPPRYQQEILTQVPFMRSFLPPTPEGGSIPTPEATESGISPQDLLTMPLADATTPAPKVSPTANIAPSVTNIQVETTATSLPTATPPPSTLTATSTVTPTTAPVTPTQSALAPTQAISGSVSVTARPASARLYGVKHVQQTWNNCGPANITQALSYYGWAQDQTVAADYLKPEKEDKNVSPSEMVAFVNEKTGVRALTRIGGDMDMLKTLIANQFPVIIETGYMFEGYDWLGHYQTLIAYDDIQQVFYANDTFLGTGDNEAGIVERYKDFDKNWQAFNRTFIVVYKKEDEGKVATILGARTDPTAANENALAVAQSEARADLQNGFAWFNMGTALTRLGRYPEAAAAYDKARQLQLPWRMMWYQFGPFEAYFNVGRYDDVLILAQTNITNAGDFAVEETYYWEGKVYEKQGKTLDAASAFREALKHNPHYADAKTALDSLPA